MFRPVSTKFSLDLAEILRRQRSREQLRPNQNKQFEDCEEAEQLYENVKSNVDPPLLTRFEQASGSILEEKTNAQTATRTHAVNAMYAAVIPSFLYLPYGFPTASNDTHQLREGFRETKAGSRARLRKNHCTDFSVGHPEDRGRQHIANKASKYRDFDFVQPSIPARPTSAIATRNPEPRA